MKPHIPPAYKLTAFNCPICNAYAKQVWEEASVWHEQNYFCQIKGLEISTCNHCEKYTIWHDTKVVHPTYSTAPMCHEDLPVHIQGDYNEARTIVNKSPRGAAALLRFCIQKLCAHLGEKGENINSDIQSLVKKGLPIKVQQALDIVRVIGNDSVHPGQIDITDDAATASQLFMLINFIVEDRITRPKQIDQLYAFLPQEKRDGIDKRDGRK